MTGTPARGRPRSEQARRAVLAAALELCHRDGFQPLTIKGIAEAAGVGRQTVYRWWPTKEAVLLEALRDLTEREAPTLLPDTGDPLRDLETFLVGAYTMTARLTGQAVAGLMAEAQRDPELADRLQTGLLAERRRALREVLERAVRQGKLSEHAASLDLAVDLAFGVMWYRLMSRHAPVNAGLAHEVSAALRRLLAPPGGVASADGDATPNGVAAG
ncbi:putative transcriptional regulator, TetR family protein [Streptomyces bingchenggensis BCW-1]|uniref:Putative transcriptional regulator, TetR family protein n=1 Tax=Streptomyces bingchenggensis (strain BCW-1) TaxID=749414 RepID=D7C327_STRBB|nr:MULTISPECIES: TetR/AcrR family transcriptional regulator [Streptomyces]ADI08089.1 putative transcriptional regulator, TetR family protein [Streptomyces bingchenggensis BCW-1]